MLKYMESQVGSDGTYRSISIPTASPAEVLLAAEPAVLPFVFVPQR
jgi:hypothetical protein